MQDRHASGPNGWHDNGPNWDRRAPKRSSASRSSAVLDRAVGLERSQAACGRSSGDRATFLSAGLARDAAGCALGEVRKLLAHVLAGDADGAHRLGEGGAELTAARDCRALQAAILTSFMASMPRQWRGIDARRTTAAGFRLFGGRMLAPRAPRARAWEAGPSATAAPTTAMSARWPWIFSLEVRVVLKAIALTPQYPPDGQGSFAGYGKVSQTNVTETRRPINPYIAPKGSGHFQIMTLTRSTRPGQSGERRLYPVRSEANTLALCNAMEIAAPPASPDRPAGALPKDFLGRRNIL